jgi:thiamine biosynthesis lipoprotein
VSLSLITQVRPRMGTLLAITAPCAGSAGDDGAVGAAFDIAAQAERVMSRHDPRSPLSRLNRQDRPGGLRSVELAAVVRTARDLARQLEGAFDPTVAPLLDLWQAAARRRRLPCQAALRCALAAVGADGLHITTDHVAFARPGMRLDLGAVGKGLALDQICATLRRAECGPILLNCGESSLAAIGHPGDGWRVVLRHPSGGFLGEFPLRNRACSTSAALGQTMRIRKQVLGHIINPRTGQPLSRTAQVSVLARSAAIAEAVSTALLVLGRGAVDEVSHRMKVDVCWVDGSGVYTTPWFPLRRFV